MIFDRSFLIFVTLVTIYIKNYNQVEASLLEKLRFKQSKEEKRFALNIRLSNQKIIIQTASDIKQQHF